MMKVGVGVGVVGMKGASVHTCSLLSTKFGALLQIGAKRRQTDTGDCLVGWKEVSMYRLEVLVGNRHLSGVARVAGCQRHRHLVSLVSLGAGECSDTDTWCRWCRCV
jgi:hypothetical protein